MFTLQFKGKHIDRKGFQDINVRFRPFFGGQGVRCNSSLSPPSIDAASVFTGSDKGLKPSDWSVSQLQANTHKQAHTHKFFVETLTPRGSDHRTS